MSNEKNKKYYQKAEVAAYETNPFAGALCTSIKLGKKITGYVNAPVTITHSETGELLDTGTRVGVRKIVDREEFIKFFGAGILSTFDMPKSAQKVFQILMGAYLATNTTKENMDRVYFTYQIATGDFGYDKSKPTFQNGLNALINAGVVAHIAGRKGWLWINPNFIAKGDRVTLYKEYLVEGSETHKQIMEEEAKATQTDLIEEINKE